MIAWNENWYLCYIKALISRNKHNIQLINITTICVEEFLTDYSGLIFYNRFFGASQSRLAGVVWLDFYVNYVLPTNKKKKSSYSVDLDDIFSPLFRIRVQCNIGFSVKHLHSTLTEKRITKHRRRDLIFQLKFIVHPRIQFLFSHLFHFNKFFFPFLLDLTSVPCKMFHYIHTETKFAIKFFFWF